MTRKLHTGCMALVAFGFLTAGLSLGSPQAAPKTGTQPAPQPAKKKAAHGKAPTPADLTPVLEDKAVEILKAAGSRLAEARALSFTAVVTYESPTRLGPPLAYTTLSEVLVERPNKLRVLTGSDGPASEFYYDGKTMTAFAPAEKLAATADAPSTIDAMLEAAHNSAAVYFPFADVISANPYKDIAQDLRLAFYVGQSRVVGGTTTDIVVYDSGGVLVQAWIGTEDRLPRRLRAIFANDPQQLRHDLEMSNWKVDPTVPADAFASSGAAAAKRIPFERPDPAIPVTTKPAKTPARAK
jgi:hypothetical protein